MKHWLKFIKTNLNNDIWGFIFLDYYYQKNKEIHKDKIENYDPEKFISNNIPLLFRNIKDPVAFHKVYLKICVQLLFNTKSQTDFVDTIIFKKSYDYLLKFRNKLSTKQIEGILDQYGGVDNENGYMKKEKFQKYLEDKGFSRSGGKSKSKNIKKYISKSNIILTSEKPQNVPAKSIVILTAMPLELLEVKKYLPKTNKVRINDDDYHTCIYTTNDKCFQLYVITTGKYNIASSKETSDAIKNLKPDYLFYLGIAGKLKDVKIGDVVVADRVEYYEPGKVGKSHDIRLFQGVADKYLKRLAASIESEPSQNWQNNIKVKKHKTFKGTPVIKVGRVATGEKVFSEINTALYKKIRKSCSESLIVECEGGGFYHSCNEEKAKGLLIRGVSDELKDKSMAEEYNSQPYAAASAAAFLFEIINMLD
ncbi:MAG TPA: hypothetical protein VJY62_11835 [Bacteroidia bacterium]|nr:hypothetical protein [Bacteroidia bacterium]